MILIDLIHWHRMRTHRLSISVQIVPTGRSCLCGICQHSHQYKHKDADIMHQSGRPMAQQITSPEWIHAEGHGVCTISESYRGIIDRAAAAHRNSGITVQQSTRGTTRTASVFSDKFRNAFVTAVRKELGTRWTGTEWLLQRVLHTVENSEQVRTRSRTQIAGRTMHQIAVEQHN